MHLRQIIAYLLGGATALLMARLVLRLLAARPDNPIFALVLGLTSPPPFLAALDAGQPRFGATLEWSTLALLLVILVGMVLLRLLWRNRADTNK